MDNEMDYSSNDSRQNSIQAVSPSTELAMQIGTDSHKLQLMKASFFFDDDGDDRSGKNELLKFNKTFYFKVSLFYSVILNELSDRESLDQIVPSKRQIAGSSSAHSLFLKEMSTTTSSNTNDVAFLSPNVQKTSKTETKRLYKYPEVKYTTFYSNYVY